MPLTYIPAASSLPEGVNAALPQFDAGSLEVFGDSPPLIMSCTALFPPGTPILGLRFLERVSEGTVDVVLMIPPAGLKHGTLKL
ncbi:hypothetical protein NUW54_g6208 [Trametes sanguinea]|uniref:Uncharacterized protein n=1 Tax=Trametes sanguinea TaxID=158606 RepID=A0ACC1PT01_9APHY|nr:hypothetical protein NUW54_g6208 [Trametes sanguinea]